MSNEVKLVTPHFFPTAPPLRGDDFLCLAPKFYTYLKKGSYNKAINYLERAFDICCKLLGELHQKTAGTFGNLIYSLIKLNRFKEAGERLDDYLDRLPQDHPMYENLSDLNHSCKRKKEKTSTAWLEKTAEE